MNIIVTGGAGFIGSNFVFYMLEKYPFDRIICLDKLTYAGNLSTLSPVMDNPNFRFVKADICDREAVYRLFEEEHPDIVVNFAAESHVDRSIEEPGIFCRRILWELRFLWMLAVNMELSAITRCLQMKFMGIYHWIAQSCFSRKKRQFILLVHTLLQKQRQIC